MAESLYSQYIAEREGALIIEESWGFIEFKISPPVCLVQNVFIRKEERRKGRAPELTDRVTQIARDAGCETLWTQVWPKAPGANDSLRAILAYDFTVQAAENGTIIFTKDIRSKGEN